MTRVHHTQPTPKPRKVLKITMYNSDCFTSNAKPLSVELGDKIFGKKSKAARKKKVVNTTNHDDTGLVRVPKRAIKPTPTEVDTSINWREALKDIDPAILDRYYQQRRLREFGSESAQILNRRLEPNYSKFGHWLFLGTCPKELLAHLFTRQDCLTWQAQYRVKQNGVWEKYTRTYYYFKQSMPDLLAGFDWGLKDHPITEMFHNREIRSFYHETVFIVNHDNRVHIHFSQVTQAYCPITDRWEDTA
ncbi:hypothetical protein C9374_002661 [Naegleria lovaniensis]|uniref:Uncharacterized protein n=1 Tax=Naegleria lovaniensis TaxID=51637 RepID=A0AA88GKW3_NAELO|nr:uncharacterized protein C9374_005882 [Naegleria lovaniensis]XP_044550207.1 uncharacterized protein C9374_002661 [Naegleria lovaniensis]KAG2382090.1 hypothetical protein C9374_005882 [Naegleria lovaniensis]KAG2386215.1 hypothetical protein C9374_002661 [Naegleria lovaniensis]